MKVFRPLFALVATMSLVLIGASTASAMHTGTVTASAGGPADLTCSGTITSPGVIAAGTYSSLKVAGVCLMPGGNVMVQKNVTVESGAALLANFPAVPALKLPEGDANVLVKGNIFVDKGATLFLGCEPAAGCVNTTFDAVKGNIVTDRALGIRLHSDIIGGTIDIDGGGGGVNCTTSTLFPFGVSNDVEDNVMASLSVTGLRSCFFGEFRNIIMSNDTVTGNRFADPDATEVANNEIFGNLACSNNVPAAQFGDSAQPPNVVFGAIRGECKPLSIH
jgi:hypothetical protein